LAVSIVCMVNPDADNVTTSSSTDEKVDLRNIPESCQKHAVEAHRTPGQVIFWPKSTRGIIMGSFYWGYALTQIASSIIVNFLGPKRFLAILIFTSSAATMCIPVVAAMHPSLVTLLRVLAGAAQGGLWPTIFRFWASWAPASERTTLLSFPSAGPSMGTIFSLILGGLFCTFSLNDSIMFLFRYGWAYFFYLLGSLGILWSVIWMIFASDTPVKNSHISENEKEYIRVCKAEEKIQDHKTATPWGPMLKSQAFWCTLISMFTCDFGLYAIWAVVPEYMNEVLLFSIQENGLLSALPHLASFLVVISTGGLADLIIKRNYLKRVNARKLFHGIGTLSPAICLLLISFLNCENRFLAVLLLIIGVALNGFMMSGGYVVNVGDFSGVHSGVVFGISNTISSIGGFCAPYITSLITKNKSPSEWRIAFTLYAAAFFISAIVFSLFAKGETEPWARDNEKHEVDPTDPEASKELMEIGSAGIVPEDPKV